ncbi:hypothetical protein RclHR1_09650010 [Rhizophagus clarus]|uniref:Uncharacterized protein n=1 Tax=Rhizophagus clarus TaxID=94130 RepID=A0A2Z6S549_9GLOM|nr:hypothetical protein RclHR1_09650010 [Rhizophagus clarus]
MSSELELLKQRITELEAKNTKLEAEKAEIETRYAELLKQVMEKDAKHITKVEQNQLQNDSAEGIQGKGNITPNNNSSNFALAPLANLADSIMEDAQLSDKAIPCNMISIESLNPSTDPLLSLAQLFNKADNAEYGAIKANQEEILHWYYYRKEFLNQISVIVQDKRSEETGLCLPEISRKNLQRRTQKAVKIYKIFEKVGIENIKYITTYSANSISELTNDKVQDIIDNFSEYNDNDNTNVEEVSSHMTEISARAPGQNHVTKNPETKERIINTPLASESTEVNTIASISSAFQSKPDHSYFRNKILDQYPNLYRECTCENFDYYGITDEASCGDYICLLCKLCHDDEEIEGEYKARSYFIKCEQRKIEIVA